MKDNINSLDEMYVVGYVIEPIGERANKYIKKRTNVKEGIKEIHNDGKKMWNAGEAPKFRIAVFKKDTNELIVSIRPDAINFITDEYDIKHEIELLHNFLSKSKSNYNNFKYSERLYKRDINRKCVLNHQIPLFKEEYIKDQITEKFFIIKEKIKNNSIPKDVNSIFGDMIIKDKLAIGKRDDVIAYIELQLNTVDELYGEEVEDENDKDRKLHIKNWNKILSEAKKVHSDEIIMIKNSDNNKPNYIATDYETIRELEKTMVSITGIENPDINEEYRIRCQQSMLGNLGLDIYDTYSQIIDKISFSTTDIMLAIEERNTELLKELFSESNKIMEQALKDNEIPKSEYDKFLMSSGFITKEFESFEKCNVEEDSQEKFSSNTYKGIYYCVMDDCDENKGGYYIEFFKDLQNEYGEIDFDERLDYMVIHVDDEYEMSNPKKVVEEHIDNLIIELESKEEIQDEETI